MVTRHPQQSVSRKHLGDAGTWVYCRPSQTQFYRVGCAFAEHLPCARAGRVGGQVASHAHGDAGSAGRRSGSAALGARVFLTVSSSLMVSLSLSVDHPCPRPWHCARPGGATFSRVWDPGAARQASPSLKPTDPAALALGVCGLLPRRLLSGPFCRPGGTGFLSCRRQLGWLPASGQRLPLHPADGGRDGPLHKEAFPGPDGRG